MRFIGLDLAWGAKNTTGGVTLRLETVAPAQSKLVVEAQSDALLTDDDILDFVRRSDTDAGIVIGVDAPLDVPNWTGERPVESLLRRCFGKYQAGAHPANRQRFGDNVRGERLTARLEAEQDIRNDYAFGAGDTGVRACLEVFPHPAHVVLFGLARTLKYKAKSGRDTASRMAAYAQLVEGIRSLEAREPGLVAPEWLRVPADKQGLALKRYEDLLDALICAYVAAYYWRWGDGERCMVIGDKTNGYIISPITPELRACIKANSA